MALRKEWFTAAEFAREKLSGFPHTIRGVALVAERRRWDEAEGRYRRREGRGGGWEYHYTLLRDRAEWGPALAALIARYGGEEDAPAAGDGERSKELWRAFGKHPEHRQAQAKKRAQAVARVREVDEALGWKRRTEAVEIVAKEFGCNPSTLYRWIERTYGVAKSDRAAVLVGDYQFERVKYATVDEKAWDALRTDYLRPERPSVESCIRRLRYAAKEQGWALPSSRTLKRRIEAIPAGVRIRAREGADAADKLRPAMERHRYLFGAMEAVNADGHKWDVFVKWDDGSVSRPVMVAFQDLYSNMLLSWRIDTSESKDLVRLCFGDLITHWGIPDRCWLDNGRAFASKWLTGGWPNRYRFKVKDEEPLGIMTALGVEIHWTQPYSGQSKPIERAFGDFARDIARHPVFAGAWCGNDPLAKPENYASKAIPIAEFRRVVGEEIARHNKREGRATKVCAGRLSFEQAFEESYRQVLIRKASPDQRRLCMLAGERVTARKNDGSVHLLGNRYWHEALIGWRGKHVTVRFDPESLHENLAVYRPTGELICIAEVVEAAGFADLAAARRHMQARSAWRKAQMDALVAERKMSIEEVAQLYAGAPKEEAKPEASVIGPLFGTALKTAQIENFDELLRKGREKLKAAANEE